MSSIEDHFELKDEKDFFDAEQKDISALLSELINQLPANYASVLNLFYMEGMSCEEISEVMDISVSNAKVILHRSRNSLKEIILKNNYIEELL